MLKDYYFKGIVYACVASIFWGLPQPLFFNELNHVDTLEVVLHRGLWSFIILFLILLAVSNIKEFYNLFKSYKKLLLLTITACLITSNWAGFIFAVGQERVQDASMGYFITPMISIILGNILLKTILKLYFLKIAILLFSK